MAALKTECRLKRGQTQAMLDRSRIREAIAAGQGILRLEPNWVPRSFMIPGRRLRLHPDDLYAFGGHRGGINERWFSSTTKASNGPLTTEFEGLSFVRESNGKKFLLKDAVEVAGDDLLGSDVMQREGGWNILCKFFDNMGPIPHHMHQSDEFARRVGQKGKPEAYYFPPQYNQIDNNFPHTFMGLEPGTTKDDIHRCLENWNKGDNGILNHSRAYRLEVGAGWQINPGILHAPGSLVTYEPQVNSDVFAMFQSLVEGRIVDWSLMIKDVPPEHHHDHDYLISMLDWDANVNPEFGRSNKVLPQAHLSSCSDGKRRVSRILGDLRNGMVLGQGTDRTAGPDCHGQRQRGIRINRHPRARNVRQASGLGANHDPLWGDDGGRTIRHRRGRQAGRFASRTQALSDPLVILKHFGPGNPDAEPLRKTK